MLNDGSLDAAGNQKHRYYVLGTKKHHYYVLGTQKNNKHNHSGAKN